MIHAVANGTARFEDICTGQARAVERTTPLVLALYKLCSTKKGTNTHKHHSVVPWTSHAGVLECAQLWCDTNTE